MILFAEDAIKINEHLYLFARDLNLLFSINITDGTITFRGKIPDEEPLCERLTCKLVYWENQIIIVPLRSQKIWIYSLKNSEWMGIEIDNYRENPLATNFRQAVIYQNFLFLIGGHYPSILKMNLISHEILYIKEPFLCKSNDYENTDELYFRGDVVYKEDTLYLASSRDNSILVFYMATQTFEWIEIGKKGNRYSGITWDGDNYWLSPRINTSIVKWDGGTQETEYEIPLKKRIDRISYSGIIKKDNEIILPALAGSGADTIIMTNDGEMQFDSRGYIFYKRNEDGSYLAQASDGKIIYINIEGEKREYECRLSSDRLCALLDAMCIKKHDIINKIFKESQPFSLCELMEGLNRIKPDLVLSKQNVGFQTWEIVKSK